MRIIIVVTLDGKFVEVNGELFSANLVPGEPEAEAVNKVLGCGYVIDRNLTSRNMVEVNGELRERMVYRLIKEE